MKPILIVEDEAIMRESLRDWLKDEGYEVETVEQGEEALHRIYEVDFGVAVLDLRLPGKNGLEVLKEARVRRPQLRGIIITAYPTVETAVEAMKLGAVDYLPKPFAPKSLEKLLQETLGPIQIEIGPKAVAEKAAAEVPVIEKAKVEEEIAIIEEEVPAHIQQGKTHLKTGHYEKALKEFKAILEVAPDNLEARVLIQKVQIDLRKPKAEAVEGVAAPTEEEVKPKECLWMKMGAISHRLCTRDYECLTCEFDQQMQEKMAAGEAPEVDAALEGLKALPGSQRLCRYALRGEVAYRLCTRLFQCLTCEFGQIMEDALQQKLAKLAARREALRKKEQRIKAEA